MRQTYRFGEFRKFSERRRDEHHQLPQPEPAASTQTQAHNLASRRLELNVFIATRPPAAPCVARCPSASSAVASAPPSIRTPEPKRSRGAGVGQHSARRRYAIVERACIHQITCEPFKLRWKPMQLKQPRTFRGNIAAAIGCFLILLLLVAVQQAFSGVEASSVELLPPGVVTQLRAIALRPLRRYRRHHLQYLGSPRALASATFAQALRTPPGRLAASSGTLRTRRRATSRAPSRRPALRWHAAPQRRSLSRDRMEPSNACASTWPSSIRRDALSTRRTSRSCAFFAAFCTSTKGERWVRMCHSTRSSRPRLVRAATRAPAFIAQSKTSIRRRSKRFPPLEPYSLAAAACSIATCCRAGGVSIASEKLNRFAPGWLDGVEEATDDAYFEVRRFAHIVVLVWRHLSA